MVELGITNIKNDQISDLVDWHAKNHQLNKLFSGPFKLLDSIFQAPIISTIPFILVTLLQKNKKIDYFTDIMQSLALLIRILQDNTSSIPIILQPKISLVNKFFKSGMCTNYQRRDTNKTQSKKATKYLYY